MRRRHVKDLLNRVLLMIIRTLCNSKQQTQNPRELSWEKLRPRRKNQPECPYHGAYEPIMSPLADSLVRFNGAHYTVHACRFDCGLRGRWRGARCGRRCSPAQLPPCFPRHLWMAQTAPMDAGTMLRRPDKTSKQFTWASRPAFGPPRTPFSALFWPQNPAATRR